MLKSMSISKKIEDKSTQNNDEYGKVKIICSIDPGKKLYINKINIRNNYKTRDYVIRDRLAIQEGGYYSQEQIKQSKLNLEYMDAFKKVSIQSEVVDEDSTDVNVTVEESNKIELAANMNASLAPGSDNNVSIWKRLGRGLVFQLHVLDKNFMGLGEPANLDLNWGYLKRSASASFNHSFQKHSSVGLKGFYTRRSSDPDATDEEKLKKATRSDNNQEEDEEDKNAISDYSYSTVNSAFGFELNTVNHFGKNFFNTTSFSYARGYREEDKSVKSTEKSPLLMLGPYNKFDIFTSFTFRKYQSYLMDQRQGFEATAYGQFTFGTKQYFTIGIDAFYIFPLINKYVFFQTHAYAGKIFNVGSSPLFIDDQFTMGSQFSVNGFDRLGPCDTSKEHNPLSATNYWVVSNQIHYRPESLSAINGSFYGFLDFGSAWGFDYDSKHSSVVHDPNKAVRCSIGAGITFQLPIAPMPLSFTFSYPLLKQKRDKITEPIFSGIPLKFGLYRP